MDTEITDTDRVAVALSGHVNSAIAIAGLDGSKADNFRALMLHTIVPCLAQEIAQMNAIDTTRVNWLTTADRVNNVAYRMVAEGVDARAAIDWLMGQPDGDE